jgi:cytochrome c peroxidase
MKEPFQQVMDRMAAAKAGIEKTHADLLSQRYDMSDKPSQGGTMTKGKAVQGGVRVKLPSGVSWDELARMSPDEIRDAGLWPKGFYPLPFPNHPEGGMLFPKHVIDEIKKQEERDLTRFDLDYDLPAHLLPDSRRRFS